MIRRLGVLGCVVGAIALMQPAQAGVKAGSTQPVGCRGESDGRTTTAVVRTIPVGDGPQGVAIDSADDTVYVTNANSDSMSVIDGKSGSVVSTVRGFHEPAGVAVNQKTDVVYVANADDSSISVLADSARGDRSSVSLAGVAWDVGVDQGDDTVYATVGTGAAASGSIAIIDGRRQQISTVVAIADNNPIALTVNSLNDRVYVVGQNSTGIAVISGRESAIDGTIALPGDFWGIAVHETDDTAYVTSYEESGSLIYISGRASEVAQSVPTRAYPWGVAVAQSDNLVYVTNGSLDNVSIFDGRTGASVAPAISVGDFPIALDVDQLGANAGTAYVANADGDSVSVLASVQPRLVTASGQQGSVARVVVRSPQVAFGLDGSTVTRVCFERRSGETVRRGLHLTYLSKGRWSVVVPRALAPGTYAVYVEFAGGRAARAGTFTVRASG